MKQTALISGANGFIGSHLKKELEKRNLKVVDIPRELLLNIDYSIEFIRKHNPQYIYHLAAYGNHSMQSSENQTVITNYIGTWNLLQATRDIPYKAFINFGTSSEYGHKLLSMSERDILAPDTFYAATKAGATLLARAYAKQYDKPIVTVRPFSVYGPGEANWRLIPTICKSIITGIPMPFVDYPEHDWIYVDDLISGIMTVVKNVDKLKGQAVNIGTGISETNKELATILTYCADKGFKTTKEAYPEMPHHSPVWKADIRLLKSFGWKPQIQLGEGLSKCWEYYSKKYAKAKGDEKPGII